MRNWSGGGFFVCLFFKYWIICTLKFKPPLFLTLLQKLKEMNLDEWKNIRGPRPWEDSREYQEQQRTQQNKQGWGPETPGGADRTTLRQDQWDESERVCGEAAAETKLPPDAATSGRGLDLFGLSLCLTFNFGNVISCGFLWSKHNQDWLL